MDSLDWFKDRVKPKVVIDLGNIKEMKASASKEMESRSAR